MNHARTGPAGLPAPGRYQGEGRWHDEASGSQAYRIDMRFEAAPGGATRLWSAHAFEDGAATEQAVILTPGANGTVAAELEGAPFAGRGYASEDALHYELAISGNRVEVTIVLDAPGKALVLGSSEKNAQGRFIWWRERLKRTEPPSDNHPE